MSGLELLPSRYLLTNIDAVRHLHLRGSPFVPIGPLSVFACHPSLPALNLCLPLLPRCSRWPPEDLCAFLVEQGIPTAYLHSGVKPMQRLELLRQLRSGEVDVIVGVNLLREVSRQAKMAVSYSRIGSRSRIVLVVNVMIVSVWCKAFPL